MKISTAIALGRTMIKALAGTRNNGFGYGCALGMAEAAIGQTYNYKGAESNWPWITVPSLPMPCGCKGTIMGSACALQDYGLGSSVPTVSTIVHLFNYHVMTKKDWTLDQLIDWLASIEPSEPEEVAVASQKEIVKEEVAVCP